MNDKNARLIIEMIAVAFIAVAVAWALISFCKG